MNYDSLISTALDALPRLAPERQRAVEYACEQLLYAKRDSNDAESLAGSVRLDLRRAA